MESTKLSKYSAIYQIISKIPAGRVATYGQIAAIAGLSGQARLVGYALHSSSASLELPWHRVVNYRGQLSRLPDPDSSLQQMELLVSEGIIFNSAGKIDLEKFGWKSRVIS
jgi:methylated-DNA-protein-cysteine methyltransferase-like protein